MLLAAQGRHPRPRMPARSGRASSEGRPVAVRAARAAERRPRARSSSEKLFRQRRAAGREVPARPSGEAGRGGGRALAHWPSWSPRPRDNNKAPTPWGRRPGESRAEIVGNSELHFPASAARSLRYVLGTIDQMEWKGKNEPAED